MRKIKSSPKDFTSDNLPKNRPALFVDIIYHQWRTLFNVGFLLLLFSLPLLFLFLWQGLNANSIAIAFEQGNMTEETAKSSIIFNSNLFHLYEIPAWMIFGLGLSGLMMVIRRLGYVEPVFFKEDFLYGLKSNWKTFLLVFFLAGGVIALNGFILTNQEIPDLAAPLPLGFSVIFILPVCIYLLWGEQIYEYSFSEKIKNALFFYFHSLIQEIPLIILFFAPYFFSYIPSIPWRTVASVLYVFPTLPFLLLGSFLFVSSVFDKYLNKEKHPELVDRGIHRIDR